MAFPGETIATGAAATCSECGVTPKLDIYSSPGGAGYYIGTYCKCGPYSRESDYFDDRVDAQIVLDQWNAGAKKTGLRSTEFNEEGAKQMVAIPLDDIDGK
jgi:hypothetical protein